jgi:hypothetical protein
MSPSAALTVATLAAVVPAPWQTSSSATPKQIGPWHLSSLRCWRLRAGRSPPHSGLAAPFRLPKQDQKTTDDGDDERSRLVEKIGLDDVVPSPRPGKLLHDGFQRFERFLVNVFPGWPHLGDIHSLVGDRFGTIMDEDQETQGQQNQTEKRNKKRNMAGPIMLSCCSTAQSQFPGPTR